MHSSTVVKPNPIVGSATSSVAASGTTALAVVASSAFAAALAFGFRESLFKVLSAVTGRTNPIDVVHHVPRIVIGLVVVGGIVAARLLADVASRWRTRIVSTTPAIHGEHTNERARTAGPIFLRTTATWVGSVTIAPIGREGAIIEAGAAFGSLVGRWLKRPAELLAGTGMAAAFSAAYHAPVAAVLYVDAHMDLRGQRRAVAYAIGGGLAGHLITLAAFNGHPVFSGQVSALNVRVIGLALAAVIPAYAATRLFAYLRDRFTHALAHEGERSTRQVWTRVLAFAVVAGTIVATVPVTAGNGLEGLRYSATTITIAAGLALCVGKLFASSAAIGTGVPAGIFSPSLAVAGGAALATVRALEHLGVSSNGTTWTVMLAVMPVGIALGLRAPLVALFVVTEMSGDLRLLPVSALVVLFVVGLDRLLGGPIGRGHADHVSHHGHGHRHDDDHRDGHHDHDLPHAD